MNLFSIIIALHRISNRLKKTIPVLPVLLVLCSCEELITVNLKDEQPKVVIESFITNSPNPIKVKITKSQDFFNQSGFTPVKNAIVQLEYLNVKEKLIEKANGNYVSLATKAIIGMTYSLKIVTGGETYSASVELPPPVPIDTAYFQPGLFQDEGLNVVVEFRDPVKTENYYRVKLYRKDIYAVNEYYLLTDVFSNGNKIVAPILYRNFLPGDTVVIELLNLERNTWRYFKGLGELIEQGINSQAPGNPTSNFSGDALGVFGAYGTSSYKISIPLKTGTK